MNTAMNLGDHESVQFLDQPRNYRLLKKGSAPWIDEFIAFVLALE
jgi:hypothetical protein